MNLLDKIKMQKKEPDKTPEIPVYWIETSDSVSRHFQFEPDGQLSKPIQNKVHCLGNLSSVSDI
ncbi:hypothetical protein NC652_014736 [Populus alba x Populus x berolinensis]|uniref:Uncharacterized protein n=1 Tax=Populus alba x Populus x berolinensis TaxID=444605 RepID=A0AAD6W3S4_9ROSI|nr:hypothetical protein NC652_014736 [Populus alba x Populus x berolinensis]KAJ6998117.1 hypothetical protein NC653_014344 [Populus alba x Populus x berolinensis]